MNVLRVGIFFVVLATLAPAVTHAQLSLYYTRPVSLTMSPENPGPGENVQLSISSYAIDLDRSQIIWHAGESVLAEGVGIKEATITAGPIGTVTTISVDIESDNGDLGHAEARIAPAELDLLWTTDSYAPPFFKGRRLAGNGATISASAIAHFTNGTTTVRESNIVYTWYRNDSVVASVSGRGKSHATLQGPARGAETIRVVAESADRLQRAEASATVTALDPKIVLYENHPLFGVLYHRAIVGDVNTIEQELKVTAVPYFARTKSPRTLSYEWSVNDSAVPPDPSTPGTLIIAAKGYTGPAAISLSVMNPDDILMRSIGAWRIIFGGSSGIFSNSSLFGE